jgi:hypothetical protein
VKSNLQFHQRRKRIGDGVKEARPDMSGTILELQDTQGQLSGRYLRIADGSVEIHHESGQGVFLNAVQERRLPFWRSPAASRRAP